MILFFSIKLVLEQSKRGVDSIGLEGKQARFGSVVQIRDSSNKKLSQNCINPIPSSCNTLENRNALYQRVAL